MQPEQPNTPESSDWLVTYGDLMSLLLCFFVLLYAISTVQPAKIQSATESLRGAFGIFGEQTVSTGSASKIMGQNIGDTISFDWGSDELTESAKQELNAIYLQLLGAPGGVQIIGRAELGEPSSYRRELDLAYSRAIAVWDYLVLLGMSRERCQIAQQLGESACSFVEIRSVR